MDIKMVLLQPLEDTLAEIYALGDSTEAGQRVAQSLGGHSLKDVPHLAMSIGAAENHIFQGNIFGARPGHPLLRRAVAHMLGSTATWALKHYLGYCKFLWDELKQDLGHDPQKGWNFSKSFGPIFLFQEKLRGKDREAKTTLGNVVAVDGHYMVYGDGKSYAATRGCGWRNGFVATALTGLAVAAAHSVAEAGQAHGVAERDVSAAASSSGQGGAALGGAEVEEPVGASSELTEDVLAAVQAAVQQEKQYEMLQPAEVENLVALGLRVAVRREGYLTCVHCKNRRKKELCFQGGPEIREHFMEGHASRPPRSGAGESMAEEETDGEQRLAEQAVPQEVAEAVAGDDVKAGGRRMAKCGWGGKGRKMKAGTVAKQKDAVTVCEWERKPLHRTSTARWICVGVAAFVECVA